MSYTDILGLNVGGIRFTTSRQTLMREPGSVLGRMFDIDSALKPAPMQDGVYFLDRDPKKFEVILNYLREDELAMLSKIDLINLKIEARYFQLTNLEAEINSRLNKMEVYRFRHGIECYQVVNSYFRKVPLEAIVKFMCKEYSMVDAFHRIGVPIQAFNDDEITSFNINFPPNLYIDLDAYIKNVRDHLVLYDEYVRVKATHININICGHLFKVKTAVALKDDQSHFYKCWNDVHDNFYPTCSFLNIDENGNILIDSICFCRNTTCRTNLVNYEGNEALDYEKRTIYESLEKLELNAIIDNKGSGPINHILKLIGFLSWNNRLDGEF